MKDFPFRNTLLLIGLSVLSFAAMGYHPGLEDDGVYLTAIKSNLNPALYPHDSIFFRVQMHFTLFDTLIADLVRITGLQVEIVELLLQLIFVGCILFSCRAIAARLFPEKCAQWAGVALTGAMFTLPVGGTALFIVDQHFHPRTVALAFVLLAVWRVMASKPLQAIPILAVSALIHPIMTAFGCSFCLLLAIAVRKPAVADTADRCSPSRVLGPAAFAPIGLLFQPPTPAWEKALATRDYLLLGQWAWYEWLGAVAPVLLFGSLIWFAARSNNRPLTRFAFAVFCYASIHEILALAIWRTPGLVRLTPMQPMRFLHLVYVMMVLVGGCLIGKYLLKTSSWRWAGFFVLFFGGMFLAQRYQFSSSTHIELPRQQPANPWLQAFAWIRGHTPEDAYFVLDPYYLAVPGEDFHCFRALAERSQLVDGFKDTAVVGLFPELAPEWDRQLEAQKGWSHFEKADFERLKSEFGVSWTIVSFPQPAGLACFWHNATLSVCQIP